MHVWREQVSDLFVVLLLRQSSYSHQKYVYSLLCVSDGQGHSSADVAFTEPMSPSCPLKSLTSGHYPFLKSIAGWKQRTRDSYL